MACSREEKGSIMPKFVSAIIAFLENFYTKHFSSNKETRRERKRREAREARAQARKEKAELAKKQALEEKKAQREAIELRRRELEWAIKVARRFYPIKEQLLPVRAMRLDHFYRAEVKPLIHKENPTYIYMYVACKDCIGATVLIYTPYAPENKKYTAIECYQEHFIKIDKPGKETEVSVLERAERIFQPLIEELELDKE